MNFLRMIYWCIYWVIGFKYGLSVDQFVWVRNEIEIYVFESDDFVYFFEVIMFVCVDQFFVLLIDIMLYCFIWMMDWVKWFIIKEFLVYKIKMIVVEVGMDFVFFSQFVYLEIDDVGEWFEIFDFNLIFGKDVKYVVE